jgi:steroid delta-isomerase-like uncharacterized protein
MLFLTMAGGLSRFWNGSGVNWIVIVTIINLLHKRMSTATNKTIVSRYSEQVWNHGRLDLADVFLAGYVVEHAAPQIQGMNGCDSLKAIIAGLRKSIPDVQVTLHEVIAEGDMVVTYWTMKVTHQGELMGVPATGKQLTNAGVAIYQLAGARIIEIRGFAENLGLMQQLGLVPTPEAA